MGLCRECRGDDSRAPAAALTGEGGGGREEDMPVGSGMVPRARTALPCPPPPHTLPSPPPMQVVELPREAPEPALRFFAAVPGARVLVSGAVSGGSASGQ